MKRDVKRFMAVVFLIIACGYPVKIKAQKQTQTVPYNQYAPTPKALEMIRSGLLPADLNSGTVSFEIPVYTFSDRDFTIPIALRYASSGFQPARQSGEAGLHWSLMAGGAITREIVGVDDYNQDLGLYGGPSASSDPNLYQIVPSLDHGNSLSIPEVSGYNRETSSDVYHFSFLGHSGSFVLNHDGQTYSVYDTKDGKGTYKIEYTSQNQFFTITTGDGYQYRFGYDINTNNEITKEKRWMRGAWQQGEGEGAAFSAGQLVTVTWLLDRITAPNGRKVDFIYESVRGNSTLPQANDDVLTTFYKKKPTLLDAETQIYDGYYKAACLTYTSYLKRMVVDSTSTSGRKMAASFKWYRPTERELTNSTQNNYVLLVRPKRRLTEIAIYDNNSLIRHTSLAYTQSGTRPLLTAVTTDGFGTYTMAYNTDASHPLPGILSNALDFWGYYNGQDSNTDNQLEPVTVDNNLDEYVNSNYMNPDGNYSKLGLLSQITYPTKGTTSITYEGNQASKIVLRKRNGGGASAYLPALFPTTDMLTSNQCGGVRVASLTDSDGIGGQVVRTFTYTKTDGSSSGIIQQFPRFYAGKNGDTLIFNPALRFPGSSFDQLPVAYSRVKEQRSDGSYTVTSFSSWDDTPDEYSSYNRYQNWGTSVTDTVFLNNILREPDSRAYRRGLPLERKSYRSDGTLVRNEAWTYCDLGDAYSAYIVGSGNFWWSARRFLCDRFPSRLDITDYPDNSGGTPHTEYYVYNYDTNNLLNVERHGSGETFEENRIVYSGTTTISDPVFTQMVNDGVVSLPVDRELWRGSQPVSAVRTTYTRLDSRHYVPKTVYKAPVTVGTSSISYETAEMTYESYDTKGNPLVVLSRDGTPTVMTWTTDGKYPVAAFVGAKNGLQTVTTQSQQVQTESQSYNNAISVTKTFTSDVSGSFSLWFENQKTDGSGITATLDGNTISLLEITDFNTGNPVSYSYNTSSLAAGAHTLVLSGKRPPLQPNDPLGVNAGVTIKGSLTINYQVIVTQTQTVNETNVLFKDFETDGDAGDGFENSKGSTHPFSQTISVHAGRTYILDWMKKAGGIWEYNRQAITPTTGTITISVTGTLSNPIDNIRFYPENADAINWMWNGNKGLSAVTDSRGITEYYSYDSYGRLIQKKDKDNNPTEGYLYNYSPSSIGNASIKTLEYKTANAGSFNQTTTFYDGLGRPYQTVKKDASPLPSGATTDLAEWTEYDVVGRPFSTWLPVSVSAGTSCISVGTFQTRSGLTYGSGEEAFSYVVYDDTPLDRIKQTYGPGKAWHDAEKVTQTKYLTSTASGPRTCMALSASMSGNTGLTVQKNGNYTAGSLMVTRTIDEDGRVADIFTNAFGETLLQRRLVSGIADGTNAVWADTYYLYDAMGRVVVVLPPLLSEAVSSSSWSSGSTQAQTKMDELAYQYRYDNRNRVIAKKLPGAEWIYCIYDKGDRLVLTQDGKNRTEGKWLFRIGDALGRECLTGVMSGTYNTFSNPLASTSVIAERGTNYSILHGYTVNGLSLSGASLLTVNWWDNYGFIGNDSLTSAAQCDYDSSAESSGYGTRYTTSAHGMLTGQLTGMIGNTGINGYLWKSLYYDSKGRVVQERALRSGFSRKEKMCYAYDFVGNLTKRRIDHINASNNVSHVETYTYDYDGWGRPLSTTHKLGTGPEVTLSSITYDTVGRPSYDDRNGVSNLGTTYSYNVRSWLTDITVGATGGTFRQALYYNEARNGATANTYQWSGNIARMDWKVGNNNEERIYQFNYDLLSRLIGASFTGPSAYNDNFSRTYAYDVNGNMTSLGEKTKNNSWQMTTTSFSYNGNQHSLGTYDVNGNQTAGLGYTTSYNILNLPASVSSGNQSANYVYSATGEKLEKGYYDGSTISTMYYSGNLVFNMNTLETILIPGGYIDMTGSSPAYHFFVTDHQGNIRAVADASGTILCTNHYDPYGQEVIPWPTNFGGWPLSLAGTNPLTRYMYSGKEWDRALSLYDFSARYYKPSANASFTTMDPLCEKYYSISPYAYCAGNPVNLMDPDGMRFTERSQQYINHFISYTEIKMKELQRKVDKDKSDLVTANGRKAKLLKKSIEKKEQQIKEFSEVLGEIGKLEESDQVYDVSECSMLNNATTNRAYSRFNKENFVFEIVIGAMDNSLLAHELKHAYQFEIGEMSSGLESTGKPLYDLHDEFDAYERGHLYGGDRRTLEELRIDPKYSKLQEERHSANMFYLYPPSQWQFLSNHYNTAFRINGKTYVPKNN